MAPKKRVVAEPSPRITRSNRDFFAEDIDDDNVNSPVANSPPRRRRSTSSKRARSPATKSPVRSNLSATEDKLTTGDNDDTDNTDNTDNEDEDISARHKSINGFTEAGDKFEVPPTRDTVKMLKRVNELPTLCTWACIAFTVYIALPQTFLGVPVLDRFGIQGYPRHYLLYVCVFWRLMYNVTLGYVLDYQSRTKGLTEYVRRVTKNKGSLAYKFLAMLLRGTLGCEAIEEKPAEFNAWVLNTQFVNVILPNDVFAFLLFAILEMNIPGYGAITNIDNTASHPPLFSFIPDSIMDSRVYVVFYGVVYVVGTTLIVTSTFSKMLSHDIIGYYAWFWGDFFFKIDKMLKFDGIFEVFPHPMYTVGYAWMYGSSMISGSYQVLALTMFSHLMQMFFLGYVEDPHIQRTYGVEFETTKITHKENIFIIHNFDPFRASDWMMVIIMVLFVTTTIICGGVLGMDPLVSENYFIGVALLSTVVGKLGIAILLYKQGKTRFWTNHFSKNGMTKEKAFDEWKRIQNLADNLVNMSFLMLSWRLFQWPALEVVMNHHWFYLCIILFVVILFGVAYWSTKECYSALGDYGWFYGDFFISKDDSGESYIARGIYRYFSHPDIVFGKFWLYALSLLCGSTDVAAIAMIHHALSLAQLITIEEPHMQRIYQRKIKRSGGVMDTLKKLKIGRTKKHR